MRGFKFSLLLLLLALVSAVMAFAGEQTKIVPNGQKSTTSDYVVPVIKTPTDGYKTVATPSLTVPAATAVLVGTLPAGTKILEIHVPSNGLAVNYGPVGVSSGTSYPSIAAGAKISIPVGTTTPAIYLIGTAGAASPTVLAK
jgi:hypothetical protein